MTRKTLLIFVLFAFGKQLLSQEYNLSLRVKIESYMDGIYFHKGEYRNHNYWVGPDIYKTFYIAYNDTISKWVIGRWTGDTNVMEEIANFNSSSTNDYPLTGWPDNIRVRIDAPTLLYSSQKFVEDKFNTGSLPDTITIQHNKKRKQSFAGKKGEDLIAKNLVQVSSLPSGLTAHLLHVNDSTLRFWLSGNANSHKVDSNFTLIFTDDAFKNGGTQDSTYESIVTFKLDFYNVVEVGVKNASYTSISDALKVISNDDVIEVGEGIFTEYQITAPTNLDRFKIRGKGPDKTIIQADSLPRNAVGRVFDFTGCDSVLLEDLTIQNGYVTQSPLRGGGIYMVKGHLTLSHCRVIQNEVFAMNPQGQIRGGGIYADRVRVINTEISENKAYSEVYPSSAAGGGIAASNESQIINTTISRNFSNKSGGGVVISDNSTKTTYIRNSTITNNEVSHGEGGGITGCYKVEFENSILHNNHAYDTTTNNIGYIQLMYIKNSILSDVNLSKYLVLGEHSLLKGDPKLDTLKFNCADTRTHALLAGSPAIGAEVPTEYTQFHDQRGYPKKKIGGDIGAHENNSKLDFIIPKDTICRDTNSTLVLIPGVMRKGIFEGRGISNDTFDASKINKSGYVYITYKYSGLNCDNFSKTDSIYVRLCNSEEAQEEPLNVSYHPNPTEDFLQIEVFNDNEMSIQISDLSGTKLYSEYSPDSKTEVSMALLKPGFYILTVSASGKSVSKKFVRL